MTLAGEALARELALFTSGAIDRIEESDLRARLALGRPLRVKFGMDPSSPDLHVGHAVQLLKLRALQKRGHTIVLIVGDSTAMVGDPSGRNKLRPQLTREEVEKNLQTYTAQVCKVLDVARTEVHKNSEWFDRMRFEDVLRLASKMTVARMLERDTFEKRMAEREPIGIHEFLYPLMQAWDSVMIRADVELGGSDQLFNLLVGRALQEQEGQPPQICLTLPLIDGLDGRKMSKSYGNAIGLTESPGEMFGKVMSIPDAAMPVWFELLTELEASERERVLAGHPREAKARLAQELVSFFHDRDSAAAARAGFDRQFRDREVPADVPEVGWPEKSAGQALPIAILLREVQLARSSSEARQKVKEGAVKLDGVPVVDPNFALAEKDLPVLLQLGRKFARIRAR
jgi:tyrosyl-tRNA synthetase